MVKLTYTCPTQIVSSRSPAGLAPCVCRLPNWQWHLSIRHAPFIDTSQQYLRRRRTLQNKVNVECLDWVYIRVGLDTLHVCPLSTHPSTDWPHPYVALKAAPAAPCPHRCRCQGATGVHEPQRRQRHKMFLTGFNLFQSNSKISLYRLR